MLHQIKCDKFRTPIISFHKGLNVVAGDSKASNSIGKSTMLMIIAVYYQPHLRLPFYVERLRIK